MHANTYCEYNLLCSISPHRLLQSALEAQIRQRLGLQQAHQDYKKVKAQQLQALKEEEEEYRRQLMAKFAEDDRIEQMTAQKRRMKQLGKQSLRTGLACWTRSQQPKLVL